MKIIVKNLVFKGNHGTTAKERKRPQNFQTNIVVETLENSPTGDNLEKTIDYRKYKKIVQEIIEGSSCNLIETINNKIAKEILKDDRVFSVNIEVSKPDIWKNGTAAINITHYAPPQVDLLDFDLDKIINEILLLGGTSFPILSEERRLSLSKEAEKYAYKKQPEIVGKKKVREQLSSFDQLPESSLFKKLQEDFVDLLNYKLSLSKLKPFGTNPISFNEGVLQKYEKGSIGITPHLDGLSCVNLILIFMIKGKGDVFICDDRKGSNPRLLDTTLGNMTILRAPGFFASSKRPFHYLTNITEERITFGLRLNTKLPNLNSER